MNAEHNGVSQKYHDLKKIHNKLLHELADAAQIIKSYEFIEKTYKREHKLLENVLNTATELCESNDFDSLLKMKAELKQAIDEYKSSRQPVAYEVSNTV